VSTFDFVWLFQVDPDDGIVVESGQNNIIADCEPLDRSANRSVDFQLAEHRRIFVQLHVNKTRRALQESKLIYIRPVQ